MKPVYILLTRTSTPFSRLIHYATGDSYTHVSIALGPELTRLYSFGRKGSRWAIPAGLVREDRAAGYLAHHPETPCRVFLLWVSDEAYKKMEKRVADMMQTQDCYKYSVLGTVLCFFDVAHVRFRHYFCSQFVAELLEDSGAIKLQKPASLVRPCDFIGLPQLKPVYEGTLAGSEYGQKARRGGAYAY